MGKDRVLSFPVQANFGVLFFSRFCPKSWKTGKKRGWTVKKGLQDSERGRGVILNVSRSLNLARFRLESLLKPVYALFRTRYCPVSFPVQGLSCNAYLSYLDTCHLEPHHLPTSDHQWSVDQCEVCICWRRTSLGQFA